MNLEQIKDVIVLLFAGISAVGIPVLIGLIWKFHNEQVKALQLFTFKEVDQQISALENTYVRVNKRLREYVVELEKQKYGEEEDTEARLRLLKDAQQTLSNTSFVLTDDDHISDRYALLHRAFARSNKEAMSTVQGIINTLISYEESLKKNAKPVDQLPNAPDGS